MDHKARLSDVNIIKLGNILNDDVFNGTIDESQQWGEDGITIQLLTNRRSTQVQT